MMDKLFINTNDKAVTQLCIQDPILARLIRVVGNLEIDMRPDFFKSLVRSIVGQLISVQAAEAIFNRLNLLLNSNITAESILITEPEHLRNVGLSNRKVDYIRDLAHRVDTSEINLQRLSNLDNKTVISQLTSIKGIGKWTAEMFLIFSLGRMDVLALDDIGTQRGVMWLYQRDRETRRKVLKEKAQLWKPHHTVASFYLWEAVLRDYVRDYQSVEALEKST